MEKVTQALVPLSDIVVPPPRPSEWYRTTVLDEEVAFHGLKALLGAADESKAGDRHAGLAAKSARQREAARTLLSSLSLRHLYDHPLTDDDGNVDSVMRVNYGIDHAVFAEIASMTVGGLKNHLLRSPGAESARVGKALTGVMAAALAKICDVHELIFLARRIPRPTKARTTLGLPGTLSSRLQPNHPTDDLRGITLLFYWGLSVGAGDALLGINPAIDTVENVSGLLRHLDKLRRKTGVPSQICVLGHIKTQLACLERGAPVEILFQSLAGTEKTLTAEFDVTVELLDHGYRTMREKGTLGPSARQFMYFETGQGSEFTYGKHHGIDMTTTEALCYGLARRYDPFMVNNVTGFIGPETHLDNFEMIVSNLQDHFMGKLLGLPMGMAPCFTLHSHITLEGQQMATQMLTAAGANYYMDVALNTDRMLAYFDTSGHDDQTLRELYGKRVTPEYEAWAIEQGIFRKEEDGSLARGPNWGDLRPFVSSDAELKGLIATTPALHGFETAGPRPADEVSRQVRLHQAVGREATQSALRIDEMREILDFRVIATEAPSKEAHLHSPSLGARVAAAHRAALVPEHRQVQILVSDGLSAEAVHHNAGDLLPVLEDGLNARGITMGKPILAPNGRVKLAEDVADLVQCDLVICLIGERPGGDALASRSLSAYLVYCVRDDETRRRAAAFSGNESVRFEYTVLSNIYAGGLPPLEAGGVIAGKVFEVLERRAAGNRLEALLSS
ncbi:ethanolamine ammonia-lyase subunit EutB [Polyangium sp. 6x1]|uniref:ethanolamine ammonia-lyase subunit EutB n=1 Tax=Polyangium sp. 6x1 TaxID=3042689 RepID=UPI00248326CD|nr:ethanolamine ammonia-lyase subunit EutB [Polyangium sp. 6x1]MDI1449650.1 ethanolamine ammonia-lyase subunit EutB [Polyangium sp. 6x1]